MKNVLILTYWSYKDALVQTYTLPYVQIIKKNIAPDCKIYLLTIEQAFFKMNDEEWEEEKNKLKQNNIILIRFKYDHFGLKMMLRLMKLVVNLAKLIRKKNIRFIHAWCTPAGALGYILSIITSKPLIIDSYEPHAQSMIENGTWKKSGLKYKLLFWLEKKQSKRAKIVIALTEGMRDYALKNYNTTFQKFYVKPALVNLQKFHRNPDLYKEMREKEGLTGKVIGIYAGKLGGIYLEEEVFDFFKVASNYWNDKFQLFLLTDKNIDNVNAFIQQKNIPPDCIHTLFVAYDKIEHYYQMADFAINPVKPVPSKRYCTSIKDGEYWAMGLPVIITKEIADDSDIIEKEDIGYVLKDLSTAEYQNACKKIDSLINQKDINTKIRNVAIQYRSFDIANNIYEKIYN